MAPWVSEEIQGEVLSALLALFVHDLRNPLTALHTNLRYVLELVPESEADLRGPIEDCSLSCDGLAALIDNLEWLGELVHPKEPERTAVPLADVVQEVVEQTASFALLHGTELGMAPVAGDVTVWTDRRALRAALGNIVRNSIQHGSAGPVELVLEREATVARVRVLDVGPALASESFELTTSAAGQVNAKRQAGARYGAGLALLVAARAAALAGAALRAGAREPTGNEFSLELAVAD